MSVNRIVINKFECCINVTDEQLALLEWLDDNNYLDCEFMDIGILEFEDIN